MLIPGSGSTGLADNQNNHNIYATNIGSIEQPGNTVTRVSTASIMPDTIITSVVDNNGDVVTNGEATISISIHISFEGIDYNVVSSMQSLDGRIFFFMHQSIYRKSIGSRKTIRL